MRKLASIRKVSDIRPIEGKDLIEQVKVDGWNVIVKKGEFKDGDWCVYIEIDSKLPERPEFEFLSKRKYIIKTMKMAGVLSEGIVFPLTILKKDEKHYRLGQDVTKELGITQYNAEVVIKLPLKKRIIGFFFQYKWIRQLFKKQSKKFASNKFPSWIVKTDEERVQNRPNKQSGFYKATEKLDGCSATYAWKDGEYFVCSRNNAMADDGNLWYEVGKKYGMYDILCTLAKRTASKTVVIQGEIIAPKVQKNKYNRTQPEFYVFNCILDGVRYDFNQGFLDEFGLNSVPVITDYANLTGKTVENILDMATFKSRVEPGMTAEGLVFRKIVDGVVVDSFKAVSPDFLISNKE